MSKTKHYVNNKDFYVALLAYHKECQRHKKQDRPLPQIPEYIGVCITMICNKLSLKGNFIRYTFLDEMIGDAIENCIAAVDNFDPTRFDNPFSYFTSIAWNAFLRRIERETTQNYTKHKNVENLFILSDEFYSEMEGGGQKQVTDSKSHNDGLQRHYDVIKNFESKQARKKEKNRQSTLKKKRPITKKKVDKALTHKRKGAKK